jgi:TonB family protein
MMEQAVVDGRWGWGGVWFAGLALAGAATAASFELRWPVPAEATVVETLRKSGSPPTTARYGLRVGRADVPGEYIVRVDLRAMQVGGRALADDELVALEDVFQPAIRVDHEGGALGLEDEDAFRKAYAAVLAASSTTADDRRTAAFLTSEAFAQVIVACFKRWNHWVSPVIDAPGEPGASVEDEYDSPAPFGTLWMTTTYFDGDSPSVPGALRYRLVSTSSEVDGRTLLGGTIEKMEEAGIEPKRKPEPGELEALRMTLHDAVTADVEPSTLRPLVIDATRKADISGGEETDQAKEEVARYEFTWASVAEDIAKVRERQAQRHDAPDTREVAAVATSYPPYYPPAAVRRRQSGTVELEVEVDATGVVTHVTVSKSSGYGTLDDEAVRTVRAWLYHPALRDGAPVPSTLNVPLTFKMSEL